MRLKERELKGELESQRMKLLSELEKKMGLVDEKNEEISKAKKVVKKSDEVEKEYSAYCDLVKNLKEMEEKRKEWARLKEQYAEIKAKIEKKRASYESKLKEYLRQKARLEEDLSSKQEIVEQLHRLEEESKKLSTIEKQLKQLNNKGEELNLEIGKMSSGRQALQEELRELNEKLSIIKSSSEPACPLCQRPLDEEHKKDIVTRFSEQRQDKQKQIEEYQKKEAECQENLIQLRDKYKQLLAEKSRLENISEKKGKLIEQVNVLEQKAKELDVLIGGIDNLNKALSTGEFAASDINRKNELKQRFETLGFDQETYDFFRDEVEKRSEVKVELERIKEAKVKLTQLRGEIAELNSEIEKLKQRIEKKDFAHELRVEINELCQKIQSIDFSEKRLEELERKFNELSWVEIQKNKLEDAQRDLPKIEKQLLAIKTRIISTKKKMSNLQERLDKQGLIERGNAKLRELIGAKKEMLDVLREKLKGIEREEIRLRVSLIELGKKEKRLGELKTELKETRKNLRLASYLEKACGRDGIQAYIIDSVLPGIEEEANRLLELLTDGSIRMRLKMERWRGKEKLDIKLISTSGERSYDSFSGGEAFRIDFALRIAISHLLAERAGKPLQTLVIDEGFGTQDAEGLEALIECLNLIESEFEKIIVITHLEEFKTYFPNRFILAKDSANGSYVRVA